MQYFSPIPVLGCEQQHYMGGYYCSCMINVTHLIPNLLQRQTHMHVLNETDKFNIISYLSMLLYYNKWDIYSVPEGYKVILYDPYIPPSDYYFDQSEPLL